MTTHARELLEGRLAFLRDDRGARVIDADTHISDPALPSFAARPSDLPHPDDYFHGKPLSADELLSSMDGSGIDLSLVWQNPATTAYSGDPTADFDALEAANRYIHDSAVRYPERLLPAGWTDPRALGTEGAIRLARLCVEELGFPIVKMNPAQNEFPIDDRAVGEVLDAIVELGAVPTFHFGSDTPYTPTEGLVRVAERIAPHPLIAVHMGGGGAGYVAAEDTYRSARSAGLSHPNIHFVLSAKRETHIESDLISYQAAGEPYSRRLSCASDAPYGLQCWNFAGYRAVFDRLQATADHPDERVRSGVATFTAGSVAGYLGGNFADLYADACASALRTAEGSTASR